MNESSSYDGSWSTVGDVAGRFDVTVRTLHHYDRIGLLSPANRSDAGHRRYSPSDLGRLAAILVLRRLGLDLASVARLVDAPLDDRLAAIRAHRVEVIARRARLDDLVLTIDETLETMEERPMTDEDVRALLGAGFDDWAEEAGARWGDTDRWAESRQRTGAYGPDEWAAIRDETVEVDRDLVAAMRTGVPTSQPALELAERQRRHIARWFYDCTPAFHRLLADTYIADPRFRARYDGLAEGAARFLRDAVHANSDRLDQARETHGTG